MMSPTRSENGFALIMTMMLMGLLFLLATGLAAIVRLDTMSEVNEARTLRNFYVAEAGINQGNAEFKNIFLGYNVPSGSDFSPRTMTVGAATARYRLTEVPGYPVLRRIPAGVRFAGLNSIDYLYTNVSQTIGPNATVEAQLGSRSLIHYVPLFQFIAFYANDLEILPGPPMALRGRIHTNRNLYLNAGDTLGVTDDPPGTDPRVISTVQVSAAGSIIRGRLDRDRCGGTVSIDMLQDGNSDGSLDPRVLGCNGGASLTKAGAAPWLGSVALGVQNISVPSPEAWARGSTGQFDFWPKADLRIVLDLTRRMRLDPTGALGPDLYVIEAQNLDGSTNVAATRLLRTFMLSTEGAGKIFYNDVPCTDSRCTNPPIGPSTAATSYRPMFANADLVVDDRLVYRRADDENLDPLWQGSLDYRRGGFFNNREKSWMILLNIDVQALLEWNRVQPAGARLFDPSDATEGGPVIFASIIGPGTNPVPNPPQVTNYGIRVFDSLNLPFATTNSPDPTGLTVVSDQAIYVEGDYNVARVAGTPTWDPAAFIGDSINVLSQNWESGGNDGKSVLPLSKRGAARTEINAAFLGGVDITTPGNYNGGLENYPRFHEDWKGVTLTYRGSFVSLGTPLYSNGPWCGVGSSCKIYEPPDRNWDYDPRFERAENLPPLTPRFVFAEQQLFDEQFN